MHDIRLWFLLLHGDGLWYDLNLATSAHVSDFARISPETQPVVCTRRACLILARILLTWIDPNGLDAAAATQMWKLQLSSLIRSGNGLRHDMLHYLT